MSLHEMPFGVSERLSKIDAAIETLRFDRPTLVMDLDRVAEQFHALRAGLGRARIHYAVKANPSPQVLRRLVVEGSNFDAASRGEIEMCLSAGARPDQISFGNTIKRASDIAFAHGAGIELFAADAEAELDKIAQHAPGAQVYIRLLVENCHADWPLTRKFGCEGTMAIRLMSRARMLGLSPVGISFHVGSQTREAGMWGEPLDQMAKVWHAARAAGFDLQLLNIGGGFPAFYGQPIQAPTAYAADVMRKIADRFGDVAQIMAEPGRGMVAEAGAIAAEVLLVSKKADCEEHRWVFLDIGRFSGLAETEGEAIRYQLETPRRGDPMGPCVLAGPSCDSADVLYEKHKVMLPMSLEAGDRVIIRNAGAYTSSYSSVGFNGFPPLDVVCL